MAGQLARLTLRQAPRRRAHVGAHRATRVTAARSGLADVARGGTLNLVGAAVSSAATLSVTILVTRHFSRPVAGTFFTATSLFLIIETIATLGAYNGVIYFIARLRAAGADSRIPAMIMTAVLPVLAAAVIGAGLLLLFAAPLARGLLGGHLPRGVSIGAVADALRVLAVILPFAVLLDTYTGASRGYREMRPTVVLDRIGRSCLQLVGVAAATAAGSAALLAPLWVLPYLPAGILAWLWLRRIRRRPRPAAATPARYPAASIDPGLADARPRKFWRFTAPRALATTAQMIIQRLDIILVGILRGPVDAAIYTAATRFLVVGQLGNIAISMAAQPQLAHLFAARDRRGANAVYQATTAWLIVLTWPLYLLAVIYGPTALLVFGHSYRAGSAVMVILGLTMLLTTGCGQVDIVLTTAGRSSWSLVNWLLAVGINVGIDLALIPTYGITGAAIGWAVALAVTNLVMLGEVGAIVRVSPFGLGCLAAALLATASFGAIPLASRAVLGSGLAASALSILCGCAVFAAGLWYLRRPLQLTALGGLPGVRRLNRR
jgi:O-antigen/teichoic acid export membrane protein